MDFGQAIANIKAGKKVARDGWNGKGMFVFLKPGSVDRSRSGQTHISGVRDELFEAGDTGSVTRLPCVSMRTAGGEILEGWLASQTDMLADDWVLVE